MGHKIIPQHPFLFQQKHSAPLSLQKLTASPPPSLKKSPQTIGFSQKTQRNHFPFISKPRNTFLCLPLAIAVPKRHKEIVFFKKHPENTTASKQLKSLSTQVIANTGKT
jgi:hypothetical protein